MNHPQQRNKHHALVIGSNGSIAKALIEELSKTHRVATMSRRHNRYTEEGLQKAYAQFSAIGEFDRIVCCVGTLQDSTVSPEKSLKQVTAGGLEHYFQVNTIVPMLCLKHLHPLLSQRTPAVFACLSAMVGSIEDNRLGGWYGYRSSKAALNMLVKTTAIEVARTNKKARIIAVHPGTTVSALSAPFSGRVKPQNYYTPAQSAARIVEVMDQLGKEDSGAFFNWNGEKLPW